MADSSQITKKELVRNHAFWLGQLVFEERWDIISNANKTITGQKVSK